MKNIKSFKSFNESRKYDINDKIETLQQHIEDAKKHIKWCKLNNKPEEHIAYQKEVIKNCEDEIRSLKSNESKINESIALDYLKNIYQIGAISSDVYDLVLHEDGDYLDSLKGDERDVKKKVLKLLDDVGGISTDAYRLEMENL